MTVSFRTSVNSNPSVNIKSANQNLTFTSAPTKEKEDIVDIANSPEKKEKPSLWQRFKNGYTNLRKGLNRAGEYIVGAFKGLLYGGATALTVIGADAVRGLVKKSSKTISTKGKVIAGIAGVAVLIGNIFNANLKANAKNADLDHRWQTGHNQ